MARPDLNTTVGADTRPLEKDIRAALNKNYKVSLESKGFSQPLGKIKGQLGEFEKSLDASNARVLAFGASAGAIVAVQQALKATVTSAINVEKKLKDINVLLSASSKSLASFGNELFKIAGQTGQSFDAVADAAAEFARQGLGLEKTLLRTRDALVLTRLSGLDVVSSVSSLTAAINSFSRAALNSTEIVNKLANVDASFAVSSADLANALSRVGSAAQDAGVSFDELLAIVTSAQQTTARGGAVIGNSLKTIFTRIQRPKVLDELERLGVTVRNLEGETRPAIQILGELAKTFEGLSSTQRSQVGELVGGVFQINILKAALSDLNKEYSIYDNALQTSINSTDQALKRNEALNETLSALINKTFANLQKSGAKVGESVFGPSIRTVLNTLNTALEGGDAESIGEKFGQSFFKGIGKFISGPGLIIVGSTLTKVFINLGRFAVDALKAVQNLNVQSAEQRKLQAGITSILDDQPAILEKIRTGELKIEDAAELVLERYRTQQTILRQNLDIVKQIQSRSGVKVKAGKAGKAAGYIPNYFSDSDKRSEEQTAMMLGATSSVKAKKGKGKIGGRSFLMNNQEVEIPNFGKNGDSAVIPTYAGGYIPNFSSIRETYEYPFRMMSRGKARPVAPKDVVKNSREYEFQLLKGGLASLGFTDAKDLNSIFGPNVQADFLAKKGGVPYLIDAKAGYNDAKLSQIEKKGATIAALRKTQPYKNYIQSLGINDADVRTAIIFGNAGVQQAKSLRKAGLMRAGGYVPNFFKGSSSIQSKTYNISKTAGQIGKSNKGFKNIVGGGTVRGLKGKKGGFADAKDKLSLSVKSLIMPITRGELNKYADFQGISQGDALEKYAANYLKKSGFTGVQNFNKITGDKTYPIDLTASGQLFEVKSGQSISGSNLISKAARYQVIKNGKLPVPVKADGNEQEANLGKLNLIGLQNTQLSSSFKGQAKGFIPNFAENKNQKALQEAVGRESSRRPLNSVRVSQVPAFRSKENPQGFVVTNTKDEPNGPSDLFARGYVPNFAAGKTPSSGGNGGEGGKSFNSLLFLDVAAQPAIQFLQTFGEEGSKVNKSVGAVGDSLNAFTSAVTLGSVAEEFKFVQNALSKAPGPVKKFTLPLIAIGALGNSFFQAFKGSARELESLAKRSEESAENLRRFNDASSNYLSAFSSYTQAIESGTADARTIQRLNQNVQEALLKLPPEYRAQVASAPDFESLKEAVAKTSKELQDRAQSLDVLKNLAKEAEGFFFKGDIVESIGADKLAKQIGQGFNFQSLVLDTGNGFQISEQLTQALAGESLDEIIQALNLTGEEAEGLKDVLGASEDSIGDFAQALSKFFEETKRSKEELKLITELQKQQRNILAPLKKEIALLTEEAKKSVPNLQALYDSFATPENRRDQEEGFREAFSFLKSGAGTAEQRVSAFRDFQKFAKGLGREADVEASLKTFNLQGAFEAVAKRQSAFIAEFGEVIKGQAIDPKSLTESLIAQATGGIRAKDAEGKLLESVKEQLGLSQTEEELLKLQEKTTVVFKDSVEVFRKAIEQGYGTSFAASKARENFTSATAPRQAKGFIPSFASARAEKQAALSGGYNAGRVFGMNIPGAGRVVANSAETVKQFPGMSQPAIMPPSFSKAGKNYAKAFSSSHGFDPYAAGGFVPNFGKLDALKQIIQAGSRIITQGKGKNIKFIDQATGKQVLKLGRNDPNFKKARAMALAGNSRFVAEKSTSRLLVSGKNMTRGPANPRYASTTLSKRSSASLTSPDKTGFGARRQAKAAAKLSQAAKLRRQADIAYKYGNKSKAKLLDKKAAKLVKDAGRLTPTTPKSFRRQRRPTGGKGVKAVKGLGATLALSYGGNLAVDSVLGMFGGDYSDDIDKHGQLDGGIMETLVQFTGIGSPLLKLTKGVVASQNMASSAEEEANEVNNAIIQKNAELVASKAEYKKQFSETGHENKAFIETQRIIKGLQLKAEIANERGYERTAFAYRKRIGELSGSKQYQEGAARLSAFIKEKKFKQAAYEATAPFVAQDILKQVEEFKKDPVNNPSVIKWIGQAQKYQENIGKDILDVDPVEFARAIINNNSGIVADALEQGGGKLSPEAAQSLANIYKSSIQNEAKRRKIEAAQLRVAEFRNRPGTLDLAPRVNAEGIAALGFIPNLAGGESLARRTERRLTGSAIRSFDPRIGTYYRSAGQPASLDSLIRRDHPEGLSQAIKNSYSVQNGGAPNFAENSMVADAVNGLVSKLDQLISTLGQEGEAAQATQQIQAGDVNVPLDIGGITINTNMESLMAEFTNQLGQVREEFNRKISAIPGSQNVRARIPN